MKLNLLETKSFSSLKSSLLENNYSQAFSDCIKEALVVMNHYNIRTFELFTKTTNKKPKLGLQLEKNINIKGFTTRMLTSNIK
jgi:hypothetical protein